MLWLEHMWPASIELPEQFAADTGGEGGGQQARGRAGQGDLEQGVAGADLASPPAGRGQRW